MPDQFAGATAFHSSQKRLERTTKTGELVWQSVGKEIADCECEQE